MSSLNRSLITPTSNPLLERALAEKLKRRCDVMGSLGELAPVALRLGLMQNTLKPRFLDAQLVVFASDHGLAVDGLQTPQRRQTHEGSRAASRSSSAVASPTRRPPTRARSSSLRRASRAPTSRRASDGSCVNRRLRRRSNENEIRGIDAAGFWNGRC